MPENRVSASLPAADREAVLAAVQTIRQKLPFLVDLTLEERRRLPKMGDSGRGFVERALTVAEQNPDILPRSFDLEEFRRDAELLAALGPVVLALGQLNELVDDTMLQLKGEAYAAALAVYNYARAAGKGAALDGLLGDLAKRFSHKSSGTKEPPAE